MKKAIWYLPRVLSMVIIVFVSIFILEGFGPGFSWQDSLSHALLTVVIIGVTIIAWKWPKVGGWIFLIAGVAYGIDAGQWGGWIIGGIPAITGLLFLIDGFRKSRKPAV